MTELNEYRTPSPKAIKLMTITSCISMFFLVLAPAAIAAIILVTSVYYPIAAIIVAAAAVVFSAVYVIVTPKIRFKRYKYLIASDRIEIIEGLIFIRRSIVPIDRIYQIDIKTGPLDNAIGVAKVVVTTAGSFASFRFLEPEAADEIAMHLNEVVLKKLKVKGAENKDV